MHGESGSSMQPKRRRSDRQKLPAPQFLSGWKEIANYLGKGVRTVQRYECELGLPVRRPAGRPSGSVLATRAELDAWVSAIPIREAFEIVRPAPDSAAAAAVTEAIRKGMAQMRDLRNQTAALRNEMRDSLEMLRRSVESMHSRSLPNHVDPVRWGQAASRVSDFERTSQAQRLFGLLAMDTKGKVS